MKYETSLDLSFNNTMSIFVGNIKADSVVLEFGPASGRLTKYLKENKNCTVYIVEIDEEAGKIAAQYAKDYIIGDILDYEWVRKFHDIKFDYILFADVLEHLRDPKTVLEQAGKLLAEDGRICLSVPNIAHNSVIIDLLNNQFNYTSTGLLDNTHVHFFTQDSLNGLIKEAGLYTDKCYATYSQVGQNEFENTYSMVDEYIQEFLKSRKLGEVYQYVYVLSSHPTNTENNINPYSDYLYSQCFFDNGECYFADIKNYLHSDKNSYVFTYENINNLKKLRFDPLNSKCLVKLIRVEGIIHNESFDLKFDSCNAMYKDDEYYYFADEDSQIHFLGENKSYDKIIIEIEYIHMNFDNDEAIKKFLDMINKQRTMIQQKEVYIEELNQKNNLLQKKMRLSQGFLNQKFINYMYKLYCRKKRNLI